MPDAGSYGRPCQATVFWGATGCFALGTEPPGALGRVNPLLRNGRILEFSAGGLPATFAETGHLPAVIWKLPCIRYRNPVSRWYKLHLVRPVPFVECRNRKAEPAVLAQYAAVATAQPISVSGAERCADPGRHLLDCSTINELQQTGLVIVTG